MVLGMDLFFGIAFGITIGSVVGFVTCAFLVAAKNADAWMHDARRMDDGKSE